MKITQNLVELLNARLKDLMFEVSLSNAIELAEDMELDGADTMKQSLLDNMSGTFGTTVSDMEQMQFLLERTKNQLEVTVQLDHRANQFESIGASDTMIGEMMLLKEENLKQLLRVLRITEEEVE
jgi:hypothetical protein